MSWPFVSRDHYDYMRETLEKRVSDLDSERKALLDFILEKSTGTKLFDDVARGTVELPLGPGVFSIPPNEQAVYDSPARKTARSTLRSIQEQVNEEAQWLVDETAREAREASEYRK